MRRETDRSVRIGRPGTGRQCSAPNKLLAYQDVGELLVVEEDALVLEAQLFHEVEGLLPRLAVVEEVDRLEGVLIVDYAKP